jgi:hypothetical protein
VPDSKKVTLKRKNLGSFDGSGIIILRSGEAHMSTTTPRTLVDDVYAMNLAKTIYREGFDHGDTAKVLSVFDVSFSDMSSSGPSYWGVEARQVMEARLNHLFRHHETRMATIIIDYEFYGDAAIDYGWHELTMIPKDGGPSQFLRTRYFETWRRDAKRGWLITKFFDNVDEPPQLAEALIERFGA